MKVGQILTNAGLIDERQLEIALSEQAKTGAKLGVILSDLGFTTEDAISRALARQSGVAHVDVDDAELESAAVALVPEATARKLNALPLRIEGNTLLVAMSNPTDIIDRELQRAGELFVRVASAAHRQLLRGLDRAYGDKGEAGSALELMIQRATAEVSDDGAGESRGAVIPLVDELLGMAVRRGATDVHLQPDKRVLRARLRIDGDLTTGAALPASLLAPIVARSRCWLDSISRYAHPQDGRSASRSTR